MNEHEMNKSPEKNGSFLSTVESLTERITKTFNVKAVLHGQIMAETLFLSGKVKIPKIENYFQDHDELCTVEL